MNAACVFVSLFDSPVDHFQLPHSRLLAAEEFVSLYFN